MKICRKIYVLFTVSARYFNERRIRAKERKYPKIVKMNERKTFCKKREMK